MEKLELAIRGPATHTLKMLLKQTRKKALSKTFPNEKDVLSGCTWQLQKVIPKHQPKSQEKCNSELIENDRKSALKTNV